MSDAWHESSLQILQQMCAANCTIEEIGRVFPQRTKNAIRQKIANMGYPYLQRDKEADLDEYARIMKGRTKCL